MAGGHRRAVGSRRQRRLWSGLLGAALLVAGIHRRPQDGAPIEGPRSAGGRSSPHTAKKRRAWMEIARLLYSAIGQHRVVSIAAGVTFFALLAMFPAIAALVSIYGIFADPGTIRVHLDDLASILPSGALEVIGDQLTRVVSGGKSTLGATFLFTLGLSLWSANAGMKALFDALNIVYDAQEQRRDDKAESHFVGVHGLRTPRADPRDLRHRRAAGGAGICRASIAGRNDGHDRALAGPLCRRGFRPGRHLSLWPDRDRAQWRWITWGSALAAALWIVLSILFSWYAANSAHTTKHTDRSAPWSVHDLDVDLLHGAPCRSRS